MQQKMLSKEEALNIIKDRPFVGVVFHNNKVLSINTTAAFIIFSDRGINELKNELKGYLPNELSYKPIKDCKDLSSLMLLFSQNNCKYIYFQGYGFLKKEDTIRIDKEKIKRLIQEVWPKQDNDFFFILKKDNNYYLKNNNRIIMFNEKEAIQNANTINGEIQRVTYVEPLLNKMFEDTAWYWINGDIYTMEEFLQSLKYKFKKQSLPYESIKYLINKGLQVYAGTENKKLKLCKHLDCSLFFTYDVEEEGLPNEIRNSMPQNSKFVEINNDTDLYDYITSEYIFINGARHTTRKTMYNAISGFNYSHQWEMSETEEKLEKLFRQEVCYTILDRRINSTNRSYPKVFNINCPTIWLFSDYGKAVMYCQSHNKYTEDGRLLIGEVNRNLPGLSLLDLLSLAIKAGVKAVEIDPGDNDRIYIPLMSIFKLTKQTPLTISRIFTPPPETEEEFRRNKETGFNPIVII